MLCDVSRGRRPHSSLVLCSSGHADVCVTSQRKVKGTPLFVSLTRGRTLLPSQGHRILLPRSGCNLRLAMCRSTSLHVLYGWNHVYD